MVCCQCKGQVPSDHQGSGCPICGKETVFDLAVQPAPYAAIVMFGSNDQVLSVAVRLRAVDAIVRPDQERRRLGPIGCLDLVRCQHAAEGACRPVAYPVWGHQVYCPSPGPMSKSVTFERD